VLASHVDFFSLFVYFRGYVEHWLLQDLVGPDFASVRFFKDFDDFSDDACGECRGVLRIHEWVDGLHAGSQQADRRLCRRLTRPAGEPAAGRPTMLVSG
jgi:hypothetical protein